MWSHSGVTGHLHGNVQAVRACGRAGYGDDSSVRFGGRWAETYTSDGATRRPSTLCSKPCAATCSPKAWGMSGQGSQVKSLNLVQLCAHIGETDCSVSSCPPGGGVTAPPYGGRMAINPSTSLRTGVQGWEGDFVVSSVER